MRLDFVNGTLEEQVDFFRNIFDTIPYPIFIKDLNHNYVYTNKICAELNGAKAGELEKRTDSDLWKKTPNLIDEYHEFDKQIIRTQKGASRMIPIYTEKEIFYSLITSEPIFDQNKKLIGILGMFSNVKLEISRKSLYKIEGYDENDNCILFDYLYDLKKFLVLKKISAFESFYKPELTIEDIFKLNLIYEEDLNIVEKFFNSFEEKKQVAHFVIRLYDDNKKIIPCTFEASCFFDEKGNPNRILGSIKPLGGELLKKEKIKIDLENAKKQLFSFFSRAYDISVYVNPELDYYRVLHSADMFANFVTEGDWNSFIEIMYEGLHPEDYGVLKSIFAELECNKKSCSKTKKEFRYNCNNGKYCWKAFQVDKIENSKNLTDGFILSFYDVTDAVEEREQRTIKEVNNELIEILSTVVEFRDTESGEHINRIKGFTRILLNQMNKKHNLGYTHAQIEIISNAATLHDIGKIAISDSILLKNGKLTPEEYDQMKLHTVKGCDILQKMTNIQEKSYFKYSYEICRHHHERYDGKGYPDGLVGDQIPLEAQIVSVADVFDALTSVRCYKPAYSCEKALQMINDGECGVFSDKILQSLNEVKESFFEYVNKSK